MEPFHRQYTFKVQYNIFVLCDDGLIIDISGKKLTSVAQRRLFDNYMEPSVRNAIRLVKITPRLSLKLI